MKRSRDLANLKLFLEERSTHPLAHKSLPVAASAGLVLLATCLGMLGIGVLTSGLLAFLSLPFLLFLSMIVIVVINGSLKTPRTPEEHAAMRAFKNEDILRGAYHRKMIDSQAGRLLDACAFHRRRILRVIDSPAWESPGRKALRDQTLSAVTEAMDEAIAHCTHYVGTEFDASKPWKDLAQDVVEGQLGGALKRLQTMLETDSDGHIIDRNKLPQDLWPVYDIAVKLQKLATEIEGVQRAGSAEEQREGSSLDTLLNNLSGQRQAEEELNQELRQGY